MGIKRLFEEADIDARVIGASKADAAIKQLEKNDRYRAIIINWAEGGTAGMELACAVKEMGERTVVAYQTHWDRDDLCRALQLGVDSILHDPFTIEEVMADLDALDNDGLSISRSRILEEGGPSLLEPDPSLWVKEADSFRDRIMGLAKQLHRPWSENLAEEAEEFAVMIRRAARTDELSPEMARATMAVIDRGRDRLPAIAKEFQVPAKDLVRVMNAVQEYTGDAAKKDEILLLMTEVIQKGEEARAREFESGKLVVLKRVARMVVKNQGAMPKNRDPFNETLKKFLGIPVKVLAQLAPEERQEFASRLLFIEEEEEALELSRITIFVYILRGVDVYPVTDDHITGLAALLGVRKRIRGLDIDRLINKIGTLNPNPSLVEMDLKDLAPFRTTISPPRNEVEENLMVILDRLIGAAKVLGEVDVRRLTALASAIRSESSVLIGRPTWKSLFDALTHEGDRRTEKLLERITFFLGARTPESHKKLVSAVKNLLDVGKNSMDAARFAEFCRQAASEALSKEVIREFASETHEEFTPDKNQRPGAAEERARVERALTIFDRLDIDLEYIRENLPPRPRRPFPELERDEVTRLRVLAGAVENVDEHDQHEVMKRYLIDHAVEGDQLDALRHFLGSSPAYEFIRSQYASLPPPPVRPELPKDEAAAVGTMNRMDMSDTPDLDGWSTESQPSMTSRPPALKTAVPESKQAAGNPQERTRAKRTPPPRPTLDLERIERLVAEGDLDEATEALKGMPDNAINLADGLNCVALNLYLSGRRRAAHSLWVRAIKAAPKQPNVLYNMAHLQYEIGRMAEARALLKRLLRFRPHLTPARKLYVKIRTEMQRKS